MIQSAFKNNTYYSNPGKLSFMARKFPSGTFYRPFVSIILKSGMKARKGQYSNTDLCQSCFRTLKLLENVGVQFEITGLENIRQFDSPAIIIANHMSTLETVVLPALIHPFKKTSFIVKQSLLAYPVFGHIMRSYNPIAVGRTNPREDLKIVLKEGTKKLNQGISILVFPQTTRTLDCIPSQFNTLGIKLAKKANVPVIPLALKTDAWQNGKYLKEFGKINPAKKVYFTFGEPISIQGQGSVEHETVIQFISQHIEKWQKMEI